MAYVNLQEATSPKKAVSNLRIVFNRGPVAGSWSVARLDWKGEARVGIRWNGDEEFKDNPQSHGHSTWFIVPPELEDVVLREARRLAQQQE